eukprot:167615-Pelagomonas_calceolata.AAC.1
MNLPPSLKRSKSGKILLHPVSSHDQEELKHASSDPSYPHHSMLSHNLNELNPAHQEAINPIAHLENFCAKSPNRLKHFCRKPARTAVQNLAVRTIFDSSISAVTRCIENLIEKTCTHASLSNLNLKYTLCIEEVSVQEVV